MSETASTVKSPSWRWNNGVCAPPAVGQPAAVGRNDGERKRFIGAITQIDLFVNLILDGRQEYPALHMERDQLARHAPVEYARPDVTMRPPLRILRKQNRA